MIAERAFPYPHRTLPANTEAGPIKLQYVLVDFVQTRGRREFHFEGVAADQTRTRFSVTADLDLARRYGISLQELPLLCRMVLDQRAPNDERRAFLYTEEEMRQHHQIEVEKKSSQARRGKFPRHTGPANAASQITLRPSQP